MLLRSRVIVLLLGWTAGAACASSGAVPRPFPSVPVEVRARPPAAAPAAGPTATGSPGFESPLAGDFGAALVSTALSLRGLPYRNGGHDLLGFDCSGFTWYVFASHGIGLPRTVARQFLAGRSIETPELRPGDLVFFDTGAGPASHVGLAIGASQFVHAPSGRGVVRVESLAAPYWSTRFVGARRLP